MKRLLLPALVAGLLSIGCGGEKPAAKTEAAPAAKPVPSAPAMVADLANGKAVYDRACFACHVDAVEGVAGAAGLQNKVRWQAQADKGWKTLLDHATNGYTGQYGTLPPKGTCADCAEKDLFDAINYMMGRVGVEPPKM